MLFFKKKSSLPFTYSHDIHSHILPGIDDGVTSWEESIETVEKLSRLGVKKLTITPHIADPVMPNSAETILPLLKELQRRVAEKGIEITLEAAAEYRMTEFFPDLINKGQLLPFGEENYLLVEHNFLMANPRFETLIFELLSKGYQPILAHPERYHFYHSDIVNICTNLQNRGVLFQLNILSFCGYYGKETQRAAKALLKAGLIHFIASDAHSPAQIDVIEKFFYTNDAKELENAHLINK